MWVPKKVLIDRAVGSDEGYYLQAVDGIKLGKWSESGVSMEEKGPMERKVGEGVVSGCMGNQNVLSTSHSVTTTTGSLNIDAQAWSQHTVQNMPEHTSQ